VINFNTIPKCELCLILFLPCNYAIVFLIFNNEKKVERVIDETPNEQIAEENVIIAGSSGELQGIPRSQRFKDRR
jgi:hypothetical protein